MAPDGLVADLFEAVPERVAQLRGAQSAKAASGADTALRIGA
jgi:hypothetical protein